MLRPLVGSWRLGWRRSWTSCRRSSAWTVLTGFGGDFAGTDADGSPVAVGLSLVTGADGLSVDGVGSLLPCASFALAPRWARPTSNPQMRIGLPIGRAFASSCW